MATTEEKKKLSFNPKVATYDIPGPAVELVESLPGLPSSPTPESKETPPKDGTKTPPVGYRRLSSTRTGAAAVTPNNTPKSSSPTPASPKSPDWYEELDDGQINMFKEVFELLDRDGGGTINSEELYHALKDLDIGIRQEEIEQVLEELDKDGNGEIDFDEFLYAMSMTDKFIDSVVADADGAQMTAEAYSRRQRLFFTAITSFAIKNSLSEIERYYAQKARQAPHVISFYTAGARLIGLNDRQLEQELKRLQKASKNQDSPYAKLPFMAVRRDKPKHKKKKVRRKSGRARQSPGADTSRDSAMGLPTPPPNLALLAESAGADGEQEEEQEDEEALAEDGDETITMSMAESAEAMAVYRGRGRDRRDNIMADSDAMSVINFDQGPLLFPVEYYKTLLSELAQGGSVVARLPDVFLVPAIRTKLEVGDKQPLCSSLRKRRQLDPNTSRASGAKSVKASTGSRSPRPSGWRVPKKAQRFLDMPTIPMSARRQKTLTIEDVPYIRKKVSKAMGRYYGELQKCHVKTATDHWENLNVESVKSGTLRENFRKVYLAYSPHKEEDVFVIAPWIPGPRYTSATAGKPSSSYTPTPRPSSRPRSTGFSLGPSKSHGRTSRVSMRSARPSTVLGMST